MLQFDVRAQNASLARLNQLLNPAFSRQPWYHLLDIGRRHEDALSKLRAEGRFRFLTSISAPWLPAM